LDSIAGAVVAAVFDSRTSRALSMSLAPKAQRFIAAWGSEFEERDVWD